MWTLLTRQNFRVFFCPLRVNGPVHLWQQTKASLFAKSGPTNHSHFPDTCRCMGCSSQQCTSNVGLLKQQLTQTSGGGQPAPLPCVHLYWLQAPRVNSANQWPCHWSFHTQWHSCPGRVSPFRFSFIHVFVTYHKLQHRIKALTVMMYVTACFSNGNYGDKM